MQNPKNPKALPPEMPTTNKTKFSKKVKEVKINKIQTYRRKTKLMMSKINQWKNNNKTLPHQINNSWNNKIKRTNNQRK